MNYSEYTDGSLAQARTAYMDAMTDYPEDNATWIAKLTAINHEISRRELHFHPHPRNPNDRPGDFDQRHASQ